MPCGGGDEFDKKLQAEIQRQIAKKKVEGHREYKLLLLGTGESGKSTILKQMQIIYGKEFEDVDFRKGYTTLVYQNLLRPLRLLYEASSELGVPIGGGIMSKVAAIAAVRDEDFKALTAADAQTMAEFWANPDVQTIYGRKNEFYLPDSCKYFFAHIGRIATAGYVPAVDDIVRTRQATTGIHEYAFDIQDKNIMFRMIDVGGQRSERRKWIHCFEHVTSIIFIVASSEYDQHLVEDANMNRMEESVALFQTIVQYQWFKRATFILFLNKMDLLAEKITSGKSDFKKFFPKSPEPFNTPFDGDASSVTDVTRFITTMYEERAVEEEAEVVAGGGPKKGKVYTHSTQATDTDQIEKIFSGVKKTIMANALSSYNIT